MKNIRTTASYFLALPALIFVSFLSIFPFLNCLFLSFRDYEAVRGIFGSEFVGLDNYAYVLSDPKIFQLFRNTLFMGSAPIVATVLLAFILIFCISGLKYRWLKLLAISVLAIPFFTSSVTLYSFLLNLPTASHKLFNLISNNNGFYQLLFIIISSLHEVAIPVILGVLVCEWKDKFWLEGVIITLAAYTLIRFTTVMSPDLDLILASYNPLIYNIADVLETYSYRISVQQGRFSLGSAMKILQSVIQIPLSIGAFFLIYKLSFKLPKPADFVKTDSRRNISPFGIIGIILLIIGGIALILRLLWLLLIAESDRYIMMGFTNSLVGGIISAILFGIISILLAYPLLTRSKEYFFLLAVITILPSNTIAHYLLYDAFGLIDTRFPTILAPLATAMGAFAIYYSIRHKFSGEMPGLLEYIKNAVWPTIVIMVLTFIRVYNAFFTSISYVKTQEKISLNYWVWKLNVVANYLDVQQNVNSIAGYQAYSLILSTIVPVALGLILIWSSKKLPLSAFSVQSRK